MFVFTPRVIVIFTFTAVAAFVNALDHDFHVYQVEAFTYSEIYKKVGDKAVLSPGSVSGPITSIMWKHGPDIAVEWYRQEMTAYRDFKGRCELNTNTGELTISNLSVKDSGSYTAEINNRIMETTEIKVITAVSKPTISAQCNPEETQCTLTCDANITKDTGPVIYSWEIGDRQIFESQSNWIDITKDDTESVGKPISCQLENPVSIERSKDIMSPITNESSVGVNTAAVVTSLIVLLIVAVLVVLVCWHKRRPGNADQSWCQCCARRNCLNCATSPENQEVPNKHLYPQIPTKKL